MIKSKLLLPFLLYAFLSYGFAQKPQGPSRDQNLSFDPKEDKDAEQMLEQFFQGGSFKLMQERMESLFKQMEKDMQKYHSLFDDEHLNNFLRDSGLFTELNHGQHNWIETKDQRILVLKIEGQEDSPLEITVENGKVEVKGRVKVEKTQQTPQGPVTSVSVREIHKMYLIPDDCDPNSVEIENKSGEILVKFLKLKADQRKPLAPQEDQKTI